MPKDTILYKIDDNTAIAYDYSYFKRHFESPTSRYQAVYYKVGDTRSTWVDYKRAIQVKTGTKQERLLAALNDKDFIISITMIPETTYYSSLGIEEKFSPYDGYYENSMWLQRTDNSIDYNSIEYKWDNDDLMVTFPEDIQDAIISLNMMFYQYEQRDSRHIIYRAIKSKIALYYGMDDTKRDTYFIKFNVYRWENLHKEDPISPIGRQDNMFIMPIAMDTNAFIFYNDVFYTYELSTFDRRWITINGIDASDFNEDFLNQIIVYRMTVTDEEMESRMFIHHGINNRYKNSVDFLLPVSNSLIVYNGLDHEYTVEDDNAILYSDTIYSVNGVDNQTKVLSVNFTKG